MPNSVDARFHLRAAACRCSGLTATVSAGRRRSSHLARRGEASGDGKSHPDSPSKEDKLEVHYQNFPNARRQFDTS